MGGTGGCGSGGGARVADLGHWAPSRPPTFTESTFSYASTSTDKAVLVHDSREMVVGESWYIGA